MINDKYKYKSKKFDKFNKLIIINIFYKKLKFLKKNFKISKYNFFI